MMSASCPNTCSHHTDCQLLIFTDQNLRHRDPQVQTSSFLQSSCSELSTLCIYSRLLVSKNADLTTPPGFSFSDFCMIASSAFLVKTQSAKVINPFTHEGPLPLQRLSHRPSLACGHPCHLSKNPQACQPLASNSITTSYLAISSPFLSFQLTSTTRSFPSPTAVFLHRRTRSRARQSLTNWVLLSDLRIS